MKRFWRAPGNPSKWIFKFITTKAKVLESHKKHLNRFNWISYQKITWSFYKLKLFFFLLTRYVETKFSVEVKSESQRNLTVTHFILCFIFFCFIVDFSFYISYFFFAATFNTNSLSSYIFSIIYFLIKFKLNLKLLSL